MLDAFRYLLYTSYYAGIMLDAFRYLLCSKLCWHNRPEPSHEASQQERLILQLQHANSIFAFSHVMTSIADLSVASWCQ